MPLPFPRRWALGPILLFALLLICSLPAHAAAAETLSVQRSITDNYKTRWSADPSKRELRTWMSVDSVGALGTTWAPPAPASIIFTPGSRIVVASADGRSATLSYRVARGAVDIAVFRSDPARRWGPLLVIDPAANLTTTPVLLELTLSQAGTTVAVGTLEYRHEPAFSGVRSDHWEYNGPGGRWHIAGTGIRTDWEPSDPAQASMTAAAPAVEAAPSAPAPVTPAAVPQVRPRITLVRLPLRTMRPTVPLAVRARSGGTHRITHLRVAIGGRYGGWVRIAPRYSLGLPARRATWRVLFQVRDASGRTSAPVARVVRCLCS